jgi:hypothetical protein
MRAPQARGMIAQHEAQAECRVSWYKTIESPRGRHRCPRDGGKLMRSLRSG